MEKYADIFLSSFSDYYNYLISEISHPKLTGYFYWLIGLSFLVMLLEYFFPWRKKQAIFRSGFWLDVFYIFFNFFLFSLIGYNSLSNVFVELFNDCLSYFGISNIIAINISQWPGWVQLFVMFIIADFIQWNIHIQLHSRSWLWKFHKVHHSTKEMSFAAHFRFHFVETIIYKTIQYVPLAMIGFGIQEFFFVHMISVLIGHLNHANLGWDYGPFRYLINSPKMHIWHHAKHLPNDRTRGVNFGLSLSVWDYIFGTAYIPTHDKDLELGFDGDETYPKDFFGQIIKPFKE